MRDRIDDPRLPSRAEIEFQRMMDEDDAADMEAMGISNHYQPSEAEAEAMAEAYFNPSPEEIERQRLLKLQCELDALDAEAEDDAEDVR
jgi:hypothetical protein